MAPRRHAVLVAWLAALATLAVTAQILPVVNWSKAARLLIDVGPGVLLLPLPYVGMLLLDAVAWRHLLPPGSVPGLYARFRVRSVAEAVSLVLPVGGVGGDAMAISLLRPMKGPSPVSVAASLITRRVVLGQAHGLVVLLGALVLACAGPTDLTRFAWLAAVAGAFVTIACGLLLRWLRDGSALRVLSALARRVCLPQRLRARGRRMAQLSRTALSPALAASARAADQSTLLYVGLFLLEALETWLILRVLGAGLGWLEVLTFEAPLSLLRSVVPLVPAGLGIQDMGYVGALVAWKVPAAASVAVALVILKRGKEAAFALLGGVLWGLPWLLPLRAEARSPRSSKTQRPAGSWGDAIPSALDGGEAAGAA